LPFEFTKDEMMSITDQPCVYLGEEPIHFKRSLIDRLVPEAGYTKNNTVPACTNCIRAKGTCHAQTFIARCLHVSCVNGGPGKHTCDWSNIKFKPFEQYKMENMHKNFKLSSDDYYALRNGNCTYCHRETTAWHMNGIDRINSNIGYIRDNCETCCHDCNMLKLISSPEEFIALAIKVATHFYGIMQNRDVHIP
jgi:hypothetical protein